MGSVAQMFEVADFAAGRAHTDCSCECSCEPAGHRPCRGHIKAGQSFQLIVIGRLSPSPKLVRACDYCVTSIQVALGQVPERVLAYAREVYQTDEGTHDDRLVSVMLALQERNFHDFHFVDVEPGAVTDLYQGLPGEGGRLLCRLE